MDWRALVEYFFDFLIFFVTTIFFIIFFMDLLDFLGFLQDCLVFFCLLGKILKLLLKITEVTTKHQK